jgi:hypothetical protein
MLQKNSDEYETFVTERCSTEAWAIFGSHILGCFTLYLPPSGSRFDYLRERHVWSNPTEEKFHFLSLLSNDAVCT